MVLLKAGAETDKRDVDGNLAIELAPDKKVGYYRIVKDPFSSKFTDCTLTDTTIHTSKCRERRHGIHLSKCSSMRDQKTTLTSTR